MRRNNGGAKEMTNKQLEELLVEYKEIVQLLKVASQLYKDAADSYKEEVRMLNEAKTIYYSHTYSENKE